MHTTFLPQVIYLKSQSIQKEQNLMTKDEIYGKVSDIIVEQLGADESDITMEANFRDDLEADSLDLVELIMAFEEEFGGEISDEEAQEITTVGQAVEYLYAHQ
jgi:acyl carrier protein